MASTRRERETKHPFFDVDLTYPLTRSPGTSVAMSSISGSIAFLRLLPSRDSRRDKSTSPFDDTCKMRT